MKTDKMWAFWMPISYHMWGDPDKAENDSKRWYIPQMYRAKNDVDFDMWDRVMDFLAVRKFNTLLIDVGDGVKLDSHPEIAAVDAVSKDFLKKKLDAARALGLKPIPKLNFSTCHGQWLKEYGYMVGSPKYREVCCDLIKEVAELFGNPEYFHLGMDEEDTAHFGGRSYVVIRKEDVLWRDFYKFFDTAEQCGCRPWVWSDYYWNNEELFIKHMPKDVLQSNWFYGFFQDYPADNRTGRYISTYEALDKLGYDQVPTSSTWSIEENTVQTMYYSKEHIADERLKGLMTVSWFRSGTDDEFAILNDAHRFYAARKEVYPETL